MRERRRVVLRDQRFDLRFRLVDLAYLAMIILPLPAAIGIHMGGCLTITLATCWLLGYAELGGNFFFAILPVFLVIYGVISGLVFWADHKSAEEVNQNLK